MAYVKWEATPEETKLIVKIVDKALIHLKDHQIDRRELHMDLEAIHSNDCKMDFEKLLRAPLFDFVHDICGIRRHIDRDTGKLKDCFLPRCIKYEKKKKVKNG